MVTSRQGIRRYGNCPVFSKYRNIYIKTSFETTTQNILGTSNHLETLKSLKYLQQSKTCFETNHLRENVIQWGSVNHQMAVPVPSISCCIFNNNDFFYQELNELAFNWDTCCHLVICLQLIASHCSSKKYPKMLPSPWAIFSKNLWAYKST